MRIHEIQAKSILLKRKHIDSWFVSRYGMNLYRGCFHNCAYCDGRSESYFVEGEFGEDVCVKINAPEILRRELDPGRRRKPLKGGYVVLGGGVGDSYQPLEERYLLSRRALEIIAEFGYPVQILTKSTLVLRDLDLLQQINRHSRALVCFSISSVDERQSRIFEPGVPSPLERLESLKKLKNEGIACGLFLLPVIPLVTDGEQMFARAMEHAEKAGVDYLIFGGMTLKEGRQSSHFLSTLARHHPQLLPEYGKIYRGDRWGRASSRYESVLHARFWRTAGRYGLPLRMPAELYADLLDEKDRVVVMLEQIDYLEHLRGRSSTCGNAARRVAAWNEPLAELLQCHDRMRGIGARAEAMIREILATGSAQEYERLLHNRPEAP